MAFPAGTIRGIAQCSDKAELGIVMMFDTFSDKLCWQTMECLNKSGNLLQQSGVTLALTIEAEWIKYYKYAAPVRTGSNRNVSEHMLYPSP